MDTSERGILQLKPLYLWGRGIYNSKDMLQDYAMTGGVIKEDSRLIQVTGNFETFLYLTPAFRGLSK